MPCQSFYNVFKFLLFREASEDAITLEGVGKFVKLFNKNFIYILIFLIEDVLFTLESGLRSIQTRFSHLLELFAYLSLLEGKMFRIGPLKMMEIITF